MDNILNIDTAGETASVSLPASSPALSLLFNEIQQEHSSWLHPAIRQLLVANGLKPENLDAIAVNAGPGSYTGLRVGLSAAKGLCYALGKPLITVNSLELLAHAMQDCETDLLVPMIDARRMEVFTAVYTRNCALIREPKAMILDSASFSEILRHNTVTFAGSGAGKFRELIKHANAEFSDRKANAWDMVGLTSLRFREQQFSDLAYTEPFYVKEFYQAPK